MAIFNMNIYGVLDIPAIEIMLDKSIINLSTAGQTEQITPTLIPFDSTSTITWTSSDTTVATVSSTGLVTCVTPGTCTITATTDNGLTATCGVETSWQPSINTIGYYKMDGNLYDSSGNGNDLTVAVSPTFDTSGTYWLKNGYGYRANFIGDTVTFNFRFKNSTSDNQILIAAYKDNSYSYQYRWDILRLNDPSTGYIRTGNYAGSMTYHNATVALNCNDGVAHNACITRDNNRAVKLYIDGTLKASGTLGNYAPSFLTIKSKDHYSYNCLLDEVIIENKVWTAQDIADYYDLTKSKYGRS